MDTVISSAATVKVSLTVYPPPFDSTFATVTAPPETVKLAVAFVPLPEVLTRGIPIYVPSEYPVPPLLIEIPVNCDPPTLDVETLIFSPAVYPLPTTFGVI